MSKSRTTQILYTRRRDVTADGELNVLASVYRFILFESSSPSKKGAESAPESSSREAAVMVRNKKGGDDVGRDEETKVLRNEAEGE